MIKPTIAFKKISLAGQSPLPKDSRAKWLNEERGAKSEERRLRLIRRSSLHGRPKGRSFFALRSSFCLLIVLGIAWANAVHAGDWTGPVEVRHELNRCVSYRAKMTGEFLVIQAALGPGWHTFAMDNRQRAQEKLAGRRSLGIDLPTEIKLSEGLELAGPWYQSTPKDFSKPELRWYSWGFEGQARFVAKVRRLGAGPARITVHGQACAEAICKNINVEIAVPLSGTNTNTNTADIDLKTLVQVR